jgi:hypothetical protein
LAASRLLGMKPWSFRRMCSRLGLVLEDRGALRGSRRDGERGD